MLRYFRGQAYELLLQRRERATENAKLADKQVTPVRVKFVLLLAVGFAKTSLDPISSHCSRTNFRRSKRCFSRLAF